MVDWEFMAQWAGEDGLPFPDVPPKVWYRCWLRYSWQTRRNQKPEQLIAYLNRHPEALNGN